MPYWIRELAGFYVVLTFTAISLAKAWSRRRTVSGISAERIVVGTWASTLAALVIGVEFTIALLYTVDYKPQAVGLAAALMFAGFGAYKLAVVARTGLASCSCTGTSVVFKTTRPNVVAGVCVSITQAVIASMWALLPASSPYGISPACVIALAIPLMVALFVHRTRGTKDREQELEVGQLSHLVTIVPDGLDARSSQLGERKHRIVPLDESVDLASS